MLITEIIDLDKRRSKVSLDGSFAFVLYKGEIRHYELKPGKEIDQECYDEIMNTVIIKRAQTRTLYLLKAMDRTEKQLYDKLQEGFYPKVAIEAAIEYVKGYHYIDDERYAKNYIQAYGQQKSRNKLVHALQQKGISKDLLDDLLLESPIDEEAQIKKWLTKKRYDPASATYEEQQKMGASLARKGFDFDNIKKILRNRSIYD